MRVCLATLLWARALGGQAVAPQDAGPALEDLAWLGLAPDEVTAAGTRERVSQRLTALVASRAAYPCFCTPAELIKLRTRQGSDGSEAKYDRRCRPLSDSDRASLQKAGRKPTVRVALPDGEVAVQDVRGQQHRVDSHQIDDFVIVENDGKPTALLAVVTQEAEEGVTHAVMEARDPDDLGRRVFATKMLGMDPPQIAVLAPWLGKDHTPLGGRHGPDTASELRRRGVHPAAVLRALAGSLGVDVGLGDGALDRDALAKDFDIAKVAAESPVFDIADLDAINHDVLASLPRDVLTRAIVEYLGARGYPIDQRSEVWQTRFADTVAAQLSTLADAEPMAQALLTGGIDYEQEAQRVLRRPQTQELLTLLRGLVEKQTDESTEGFQSTLDAFREQTEAPGRSLGIVRIAVTGQREGPKLAAVMELLGKEALIKRIDRAIRMILG